MRVHKSSKKEKKNTTSYAKYIKFCNKSALEQMAIHLVSVKTILAKANNFYSIVAPSLSVTENEANLSLRKEKKQNKNCRCRRSPLAPPSKVS